MKDRIRSTIDPKDPTRSTIDPNDHIRSAIDPNDHIRSTLELKDRIRATMASNNRGQSTLDFLLGTVIFLLAVVIVIAVIPGMLDPFATGSEADPVIADRAVSTLVSDELSSPDSAITTPENVSAVFDQDESELATSLRIDESVRLNVTLDNRTGIIENVGPTPPSSGSVTAAWRVIFYEGAPANVTVRVW